MDKAVTIIGDLLVMCYDKLYILYHIGYVWFEKDMEWSEFRVFIKFLETYWGSHRAMLVG